MKVSDSVYQLVFPIAQSFELELVEVEYAKKPNGMNLTLFIDKVGGVSLEDCEKLHRAVDEPLDELDPTDGAQYTLNVSSLGLDRPIKSERDFERNLNKIVAIKLYAPIDGVKQYTGTLVKYSDTSVTIIEQKTNKQIEVNLSAVALMQQYIEF